MTTIEGLLAVLGAYLGLGLLFAVPFACVGAGRIDPGARGAGAGFRAVLIPGAALFWPLLLKRWIRSERDPIESNAHRRAAR